MKWEKTIVYKFKLLLTPVERSKVDEVLALIREIKRSGGDEDSFLRMTCNDIEKGLTTLLSYNNEIMQ